VLAWQLPFPQRAARRHLICVRHTATLALPVPVAPRPTGRFLYFEHDL